MLVRRGWWRRRAVVLGALGVLAVALVWPRPAAVELRRQHSLPHRPATLAHMLADFNYQARLYPHIGSWSVESESGNYTWWVYSVRYACGARCSGEAELASHERTHAHQALTHTRTQAHGPAASHRLLVAHTECTHMPVLHWPNMCESWWTDTEVVAEGAGGATLTEHAHARCSVLGALSGACASRLAAQRDRHASRLRALLLQHDAGTLRV